MSEESEIRQKIRDYLVDGPSPYTLRCLLGMLEGKEATEADFLAVGGIELLDKIRHLEQELNRNE